MKYKQFLKISYPEKMAAEESSKNILYRSYRKIGLCFSYPLYLLKLSANSVSILRLFLVSVSLYCLLLATNENFWLPLISAAILLLQNILDYSDGAIARVTGKTSKLGAFLDGIANVYARGGVLILFGIFAQNILFLVFSIFSLFILINFREKTATKKLLSIIPVPIKWLYRISLSIEMMLFVLPTLMALNNSIHWPIVAFSGIVIMIYTVLAILWISFCISKSNHI